MRVVNAGFSGLYFLKNIYQEGLMFFRIQQMRLSIIIPVIFLLILSLNSLSFGESVFLKDGNILEGKISNENDKKITITFSADETREIERKDIIRTVYHNNYKDKRYLTKMDGTVLEVYIVDEDKTGYIYRLKLDSPDEVRIAKDDVDGISKRKITTPVVREETREEKLITRAPRIRFGLTKPGPGDKVSGYTINDDYDPFRGVILDLFLFRLREVNGNGFDFFIRGVLNSYKITDPDDLGFEQPSGYLFDKDESELEEATVGGGIRYVRGWYLGGLLLQGYLLGYYQYSNVDVEIEYVSTGMGGTLTEKTDYTAHGVSGGAGLEIGLFANFGIFGEYTYGYSKVPFPAGDENFEGGSIRFGVSIRTSYL
jgi:hypothetical protein